MKTAILIDGGYFLRRFRSCYPTKDATNAKEVAKTAFELALSHLSEVRGKGTYERTISYDLHRIFFYDCPPLTKRAHLPISRRAIDFAKTPQAIFRNELHDEIRCLRKMALRLGHLSDHAEWNLKEGRLKAILSGSLLIQNLTDDDFVYETRQKGVDMRIGTDIATLSYKRNVEQIVLVADDADFVPAAKLARREGLA
jgi:uncharacterized LabA/DUF88 family protein